MIAGARETISMNNILCRDYVRYYQKDYDRDLHGTTLIVNIDPWGIAVTYSGYLLLALSFMGILMRRCNRRIFLIATLLGTIIAVVFLHKDYGIPVLNTWLMPIHVSLIITAYSLFPFAIWRREILHTALAFLAMGICLGAYWAGISWGTYWSWDPKETCALITLLVYAIPLHSASLPLFRSQRFYRLYMTLALLSILMTYFGANLFFGGLHSYR